MKDLKLHKRLVIQIEADRIHLDASEIEVKRVKNLIVVHFKFNDSKCHIRQEYSNYGMTMQGGTQ